MLSGVYVFAIGQGTAPKDCNPAFDAKWQAKAKRPRQKVEYSLQQVLSMIAVLEPVDIRAAAVAVCYFASCRPAEARGLRLEHWHEDESLIAGTIHLTHPACAQWCENLIRPEFGPQT